MNATKLMLLCLILFVRPAFAEEPDADYTRNVGQRVAVYEQEALNYRIDLASSAYTFIDFSKQVPEASFAAIRFRPNVFVVIVAEDLGPGITAEQYAEVVQGAMQDKFDDTGKGKYEGSVDVGVRDERGMEFFQKTIHVTVGSIPVTYVLSTLVDGSRAYQLLTFASHETDEEVLAEANAVLGGFSIMEPDKNRQVVIPTSVKNYRSATFGYRFRARERGWFAWNDLSTAGRGADFGAQSTRGYAAIVMPVCWTGARPNDDAIYRVVMQQFGEDYPSDFITEEYAVKKDGAGGKLFVGHEENENGKYVYLQWIVANDRCAYTLAAWGDEDRLGVRDDLAKVWKDFEILPAAGALKGDYQDDAERSVNAYLINAFGLHYYAAHSFRDAFSYFEQASDLEPGDETYLVNALRALAEIDAFHEAADWIEPRLAPFADNDVVQSWDAWLAYQTDDPDKALRIYDKLFAADYRDNDDFSVYMNLLADAERWDDLDARFATYTQGEVDDEFQKLHVQLLARRKRFEEALAILDKMVEGRPFNADLAYERMSILDQAGRPAEVLRVAEDLIARGYRSLQSYYRKGDAEYQLRSFREARASFEEALGFAPANTQIKEYLDAIEHMLGEGDTTSISQQLEAVKMPRQLQQKFAAVNPDTDLDGYGAVYFARITGYDFDGGDILRESLYRKIHILDDNGVTQFNTLEFDFDPAYESLYVNRLVVRDSGGEVTAKGDLNTYYITKSDSGYEASTQRTVHLPVPGLAPGSTIEAVITKNTAVEDGTFPLQTEYLSTDRPIAYSAVFVNGRQDRIRYQVSGVQPPRKLGKALVFERERPVAFRWEPLQPVTDQILPWVRFGTVSASWADAGTEYLEKISDKLDVTTVKERAERLVAGVDSQARKIEILSAFVQDEIHYKAIEFGRRAYMPKTARETIRDRYGDCKDHAVLLYSLLEASGIDASLALVNLREQVLPELPNTDQFDHMIVAVHTDAGRLFVDTTDKDLRLGSLPPRSVAGNYALELGEAPELVHIPDYDAALTGISVKRGVEARNDGRIDVVETARFTGYQAAELRGQLRSIETSELHAALQRWIATRYSDAELTDYLVDNVYDAGYDLLVEMHYTLPVEADGTFDIPGFLEAYYLEFDRVADRRFPFEHVFPLRVSAVTSVTAPPGMQLATVSKKPDAGASKFGHWRRAISKGDSRWEIHFDYVASDERFAPEDYRKFSDFQRQAVDAIEQALVLQ